MYGARIPRYDTKECADFYEMIDAWSTLMEPGRHPPIDLLPILKLVPERWALWRHEAKIVRDMQRRLYFHMLDMTKERMAKGEGVGAFMEDIIQNAEQLGMDDDLLG